MSNKPLINLTIMGIGNAGINAVENMSKNHAFNSQKFLYVNIDEESLNKFDSESIILLDNSQQNYNNVQNPLVGKVALTNSIEKIKEKIKNTEILILIAGLGGVTGTGALPLIAKTARDMGIITVAIVSTPFSYEGTIKENNAHEGLKELEKNVDSIITISNNRIINNYPDVISLDAFKLVDNVIKNCVKSFINLITKSSTISLSIPDLISAIKDKGETYIGFGSGLGRNKINRAIKGAINSKIIETPIKNAKNIVLNIIGDPTFTVQQINDVVKKFEQEINSNANIIFSFDVDQKLVNEIQISVFATFDKKESKTYEKNKLHNSQELLLEIGNTLENELSAYSTGELDLPAFDVEKMNSQLDDKDQEDFVISSEESNDDDDIPFFLK